MIVKELQEKEIKNMTKFYKALQQDYLIVSDFRKRVVKVMAYREKGEPLWLTRLILEKDVERAASLS